MARDVTAILTDLMSAAETVKTKYATMTEQAAAHQANMDTAQRVYDETVEASQHVFDAAKAEWEDATVAVQRLREEAKPLLDALNASAPNPRVRQS